MPDEPSPQSYINSVVNAVHDRTATPSPRPRGSVSNAASAMAYTSEASMDDDIDNDEIDRRLAELQAQVCPK